MFRLASCLAVLVVVVFLAADAEGLVVRTTTVPGISCPNFAGQTAATLAAAPDNLGGDNYVPETLPPSTNVAGYDQASITASGTWGFSAGEQNGPEGRGGFRATESQYEYFGISALRAPLSLLAGVFTTDAGPTMGAAPYRLDYEVDDMTSPLLNQVFGIGPNLDDINIPEGATKLYFGHHDAYNWQDNVGSLTVTTQLVPEPSTLALLVITGLLAYAYHRKR